MFRYIAVLLFVSILGFWSCGEEKQYSREQVITEILVKTLRDFHYSNRPLNNTLAQDVFNNYLKRLDSQKKFFRQEDIQTLNRYKLQIDDQLRQSDLTFYDQANGILLARIREVQQLLPQLLSNAFDFSVDEDISFDFDALPYTATPAEFRERWRLILKYQVLRAYLELDTTRQPVVRPELEKKARQKVSRAMNRMLDRMEKQSELDRFQIYMNAIASVFDPHTGYFPPKQDQDFKIEMTGRLEGIGAMLSEQDGNIKVVQIVPGSAAWRQKQLEAEDIILQVGEGSQEPVDVVEMPLDDAVQLIRGRKGTEVRLTVKKPDGRILFIPIVRDAVVLEETYARSVVLEDKKNGLRVGYIDLPAFYHDFDNEGSRSSAEDVRQEIQALKARSIQGLILDLRNNGGGALEDAVRLSGLFIPSGPIVQVRDKTGTVEVLRDNDPGVAWEGPLIVLVNTLSASASEIVGAALQDYGRALIVGSSHTFGKGTVQSYVNIDRFVPMAYQEIKPLGALKITLQKFYRVNGDSTQYKGVVPDIVLPDLYEHIELGEKYTDYSLGWDRIKSQEYTPWAPALPVLDQLQILSRERLLSNQVFSFIRENARFVEQQQQNQSEPLLFTKVLEREKILQEKNQELTVFQKSAEAPVRLIHLEGRPLTASPALVRSWEQKIISDKYLVEVLALMQDLQGK